mmetsp:Transcript_34638/g.85879  ORF Transcript_34638/g.85879 Transcript_34638/m.85879 type:complete len:354 (-) Transcript_34638:319-1380(-)
MNAWGTGRDSPAFRRIWNGCVCVCVWITSLEDFAVDDRLAVDHLVGTPIVLEQLLVGGVVQVNRTELVILIGGVVLHVGRYLGAAEQPRTLDVKVTVSADHVHDGKPVLAQLVAPLYEAAEEVAGHESDFAFALGLDVLDEIQTVALGVVVLPEPFHRHAVEILRVGVRPFPLVHDHLGGRQQVQRIGLLLGRRLFALNVIAAACCRRCRCVLFLFLFLLLGSLGLLVLLALPRLGSLGLARLQKRWLVDARVVPSHHIGEGRLVLGVECLVKRGHECCGHDDVSQGDVLPHQEGLVQQVLVDHLQRLAHVVLGPLRLGGRQLVGGALQRVHPAAQGHLQLVHAEIHPRVNQP